MPRKDSCELTPLRRRFAEEYVRDYHAVEAYVRAGFSPRAAIHNAHRLLKLGIVREEVKRLEADRLAEHGHIVNRNINELANIAYSSITDVIDLSSGSPELKKDADGRLIESVEETRNGLKVKMHSKLSAIDQLNKLSGAYSESVDITSGGQPIQPALTVVFEVVPMRQRRDTDAIAHNDTV